jgi:Protein of unknown function (DUF4239)
MENYVDALIHFDLDRYSVGAFYISLAVALSVGGQLLFKRWMGTEAIASCHEVGGYYMAIVGSLYAVVLGLVIFDAISNFQEASLCVKDEAKALLAVYALADQFPENGKVEIKAKVRAYVEEVVGHEWEYMDQSTFSPRARKMMWALLDVVKRIEPHGENQKALLPLLVNEVFTAWSERRERIEKIGIAIPGLEWFVLLAGAIVTIIFTYFFTISIGTAQLLMTAMISFMVAINLYLVLLFGNPYSGDLRISATAFKVLDDYIQDHLTSLDGAGLRETRENLSQMSDNVSVLPLYP